MCPRRSCQRELDHLESLDCGFDRVLSLLESYCRGRVWSNVVTSLFVLECFQCVYWNIALDMLQKSQKLFVVAIITLTKSK